ncbi:hypothetical protein P3L10_027746 [Capsicum annuum]
MLGANDGLVSIASLMMGVGGEFVSVYSRLDIKLAQMKRDKTTRGQNQEHQQDEEGNKEQLPNPFQVATTTSSIAFSLGAIVPILAATFTANHKVRLAMIAGAWHWWYLEEFVLSWVSSW